VGTTKRERQKANRQQRLEEMARTARKDKTKRTATLVSVVVIGGLVLLFGLSYLFADDDDDDLADVPTTPLSVPATTLDAAPTTTFDPNATTTTEGPTTTVATAFEFGTAPCPEADGSTETPETFGGPPSKCIDETKGYVAEVVTSKGTFEITLDAEKAPGNVNNFVTLARYGYYDGTDCHRIIKDFAVQCGRRNGDETAPGYTVADELPAPDSYSEGVVAMANTGQPNSAGGQFFIIVGESGASLPPSYTILGRITKGQSTVQVLENLADPLAQNGVPPLVEIEIESITIEELDAPPETTIATTTSTTSTTLATDPADTSADTTGGTTADTTDIPSSGSDAPSTT
jgi:cyclophilin family peptidyl-prolyl cis-trans isomerase